MNYNQNIGIGIFICLLIELIILPSAYSYGWYYGTLHDHTGYSSLPGYDGTYFTPGDNCIWEAATIFHPIDTGYSIFDLKFQAKNKGLSWQSYTDHSYCLNSDELNTVKNDCDTVDQDASFTCLAGEELGVKDDQTNEVIDENLCLITLEKYYKAAHLGAVGISDYISQTPDDVYCPKEKESQDGINAVNNEEGVSIIHHPLSSDWDFDSVEEVSDADGIEIWNGDWENSITWSANNEEVVKLWRSFLLLGKKYYAYGGTDTHGSATTVNYNAAYMSSLSQSNLKDALKSGKNTVSNNGLLYIELKHSYSNEWSMQGSTVDVCYGDGDVQVKATYEDINHPCKLTIYKGVVGDDQEYHQNMGLVSGSGSWTVPFPIDHKQDAYIRAECISDDGQYRIYTNPIFIEVDQTDQDGDGSCSSYDNDESYPDSNPSAEEICDGFDNDQDGQTDEGGVCGPCENNEETLQGCKQKNLCLGTSKICVNGEWSSCNYPLTYESHEESCDNKDNDCDGQVDEGCDDEDEQCKGDEEYESCTLNAKNPIQASTNPHDVFPADSNCVTCVAAIAGYDYGTCWDDGEKVNCKKAYATNFNLKEGCEDIFDLNGIYSSKLNWKIISDEKDIDKTRLKTYKKDESDLVGDPWNYKDDIIDSDHWEILSSDVADDCVGANCYNSLIDEDNNNINQLATYMPMYGSSKKITLGFWPQTSQEEWQVSATQPYINVKACQSCPDNDNDAFNPSNSNCGTKNDCDDNNVNIYPYNVNPYCNCNEGDGYTQNVEDECLDDEANHDDDCDGVIDEGCDDDGDGYVDDALGGTDEDDTNPSVNDGMAEHCSDGIDNDQDGDIDCADAECNGVKCGLCKVCSGGSCSGTPSDDGECGIIDCSGWYSKAGQQGPTSVENCFNKKDLKTDRCDGFGVCNSPNTEEACEYNPNDEVQYSCGSCKYITGSACTETTLGSCSYYGTSTECSSSYLCSNSAGGNNAYGAGDEKVPSIGYCDGAGSCDYSDSSPVCDYAAGVEGSTYSSVCANGQSSCIDSCTDGIDNDGNGKIDCGDLGCNCPVTVVDVEVTPSSPYTNDILDCKFKVTGPEPLTVDVTWFKNEGHEPWTQDNENDILAINNVWVHTTDIGDIEPSDTSAEEIWKCSVNAYSIASEQYSGWKNSTGVIIQSIPPALMTTILNSTFGTNMSNESLKVYPKDPSDPDNLNVQNITNWRVNGTSIAPLILPLIYPQEYDSYNWTYDFSGYNNHAKLTDKPKYLRKGIINGSFVFTDADDAIIIPDSNTLDLVNNYSIEMWVNWTDGSDNIEYLIKKPEAFYIALDSVNGLLFAFWDSTAWQEVAYRDSLQTGVYSHIVARWDGNDKKIFVNGAEVAHDYETSVPVVSSYDIYIGQDEEGNNQFNGEIDEVRIYNRSLSSQQINKIYTDITSNVGTPYDTIVSQETQVNDVWQADVIPYNGILNGTNATSNTLTILEVCYEPWDNMYVSGYLHLCSGTYNITDSAKNGIIIPTFDNTVIKCDNTWINGSGSGKGIAVNFYNNISISGCTFSNYDYGIYLYSSNNVSINNDTFYANSVEGLHVNKSDENNVTNNTFMKNGIGINLPTDTSDNNSIMGNRFFGNTTHEDGVIDQGTITNLCVNDVYGNYYDLSVGYTHVPKKDCSPTPNATIMLYDKSEKYNWTWGSIGNATYNNLREVVYNTETNDTITGAYYSGIYYLNDTDTIRDNITLDCNGTRFDDRLSSETAIDFGGESGWIIKNCTFKKYQTGIFLDIYSYNNTIIINNLSSNSQEGVYIDGDSNNITDNMFYNNSQDGVTVTTNGEETLIWNNRFVGINNDGVGDNGIHTNFCVDDNYGNYYSEGVIFTEVPWYDCGPTPNGTIILNKNTEDNNFTWGGNRAAYSNLQEAVYNTFNRTGNKIFVLAESGPYYENYTDTVRTNILLDCNKNTFDGKDTGRLIYFRDDGHNTISNCTIQNYDTGLHLSISNANLIENITFSSNDNEGIYLTNSDYNEIRNSSFTDNVQEGIDISDATSTENKIWKNKFSGVNTGGVTDSGTNTLFCDEVGNYYEDGATNQAHEEDCGPIPNGTLIVDDDSQIIIDWDKEVVLNSLYDGLHNTNSYQELQIKRKSGPYTSHYHTSRDHVVINCSNATLFGESAGWGLIVYNENTTVYNCTFDDYDYGIRLDNTDYSKIVNCTFINNDLEGILIGNDVNYALIKHNNFTLNEGYGIYFDAGPLGDLSTHNYITENVFKDNSDYAVYMDTYSENTNVWRNNFIHNNDGETEGQAYNDDATTLLDISSNGNYWTDYDSIGDGCVDSDSNGFCDSPQTNITGAGGIDDNYPYINFVTWP